MFLLYLAVLGIGRLVPQTTEGYSLPGGTKYDEQPSIILGIGGQLDDAGQVLVVAGLVEAYWVPVMERYWNLSP